MKTEILDFNKDLSSLINSSDNYNDTFLMAGNIKKLAFNASSQLVQYWDDIDITVIKKFCRNEQKKGNMVAGYLSYDLGLYMHNIEPKNKTTLPLFHLYSYRNYLEQSGDKIKINYHDDDYLTLVKNLISTGMPTTTKIQLKTPFEANLDKNSYIKAFNKVQAYIKSGDVYQMNLTYPLRAKSDSSSKDIFTRLYDENKVEKASFFQSPEFDLISMSPETFITIKDRTIETFPIKGTRARSQNNDDKHVVDGLINDKKEAAELNMITDLLRNDLSIVCADGTVKIKKDKQIMKLTNVIHTYSHIVGDLKPDTRSIDALLGMFPGGSISGCPKKRAIEIIDEVEQQPRGPYTGTLFTLDPKDNLDSNMLIRTIIKQGDDVSLPVGGGIVFDSTAEKEHQETIDKSLSITSVFASSKS